MGYTHYFYQKSLSDEQWSQIKRAVKSILKKNSNILANEIGEKGTKPILNDNKICFNGIEDDSYETLLIRKEPNNEFNFCKTAYKPYDSVVVEVLQVCKDIAPDCFKLSSDSNEPGNPIFK